MGIVIMENQTKNNVQLILKNTDALSGTPKILMRQAFALSNLGHKVSVISETFHPSLISSQRIKCIRTLKWPKNTLTQRKFFNWQAARKTDKNALVVGHGDTLYQDVLFMHTCVHKGAEVAPGPHNNKNLSIPFHKMIFEQGHFKEVVCVSHMMKNDLQKRFNIKVPMHVIYPGHDKDIVKNIDQNAVKEIRSNLKVEGDEIVIAVIASGNLENRGAFTLLRALGTLDQFEKDQIKVLIVGKESKPAKIYQLASEMGLKDKVLWMNPRPDVGNIISAADLVVHAAHIEAAGITFLECLALGKPVITTKTVGFSEILPDIQKDFIIEKQEAQAIAEKVRILLKDKNLRLAMGRENQAVASVMTWERYDQQCLEIFSKYL